MQYQQLFHFEDTITVKCKPMKITNSLGHRDVRDGQAITKWFCNREIRVETFFHHSYNAAMIKVTY